MFLATSPIRHKRPLAVPQRKRIPRVRIRRLPTATAMAAAMPAITTTEQAQLFSSGRSAATSYLADQQLPKALPPSRVRERHHNGGVDGLQPLSGRGRDQFRCRRCGDRARTGANWRSGRAKKRLNPQLPHLVQSRSARRAGFAGSRCELHRCGRRRDRVDRGRQEIPRGKRFAGVQKSTGAGCWPLSHGRLASSIGTLGQS